MKTSLMTLVLMLITSPAFSQSGNSAGGGGTVLILKDDTVVMADAYFVDTSSDSDSGQVIKLGAPLREEILRARDLMVIQSGFYASLDLLTLFESNIFSDQTQYILVDEIPNHCPYIEPLLKDIPDGARVEKVACTDQHETFLVKSIFEKMSLREQALQIIHERLRAEPISLSHRREMPTILKSIYVGLSTGLKRLDQEMKGNFTPITTQEITDLEQMAKTIKTYEILRFPFEINHREGYYMGYSGNRKRNLNGGGFQYPDEKVDPTAYLGLSVLFGDDGMWSGRNDNVIEKNAILASPRLLECSDCKIQEDAQFYGNAFFSVNSFTKIHLQSNARAIQNRFHDLKSELGDGKFKPSKTELDLIMEEGTSVQDSTFEYSTKGKPAYILFNVVSGTHLDQGHFKLIFSRKHQRTLGAFTWPAYIPAVALGIASPYLTVPFHNRTNNFMYEANRYVPRITQGRIRIDLVNLQGHVQCASDGIKRNKIKLSAGSKTCISLGEKQ